MWAVNVGTEVRSVRVHLTGNPGDFDPHLQQQTSNQKNTAFLSQQKDDMRTLLYMLKSTRNARLKALEVKIK